MSRSSTYPLSLAMVHPLPSSHPLTQKPRTIQDSVRVDSVMGTMDFAETILLNPPNRSGNQKSEGWCQREDL